MGAYWGNIAYNRRLEGQIKRICLAVSKRLPHPSSGEFGGCIDELVSPAAMTEPLPLHKARKPDFGIPVRDTGHGIAPENPDRVFSPPFFTTTRREGTGLDLSVSSG